MRREDKAFTDLTQEIDIKIFQDIMRGSFSDFPDHHIISRRISPIWYISLVILSAYLAGCNTVADLAYFSKIRSVWFINLTGIEDKAPSYNTYGDF